MTKRAELNEAGCCDLSVSRPIGRSTEASDHKGQASIMPTGCPSYWISRITMQPDAESTRSTPSSANGAHSANRPTGLSIGRGTPLCG